MLLAEGEHGRVGVSRKEQRGRQCERLGGNSIAIIAAGGIRPAEHR